MTVPSLDKFKQSTCQNEYKAFFAGAAMTGLGFDLFFARVIGLGEIPHLALAGAGVDVWCRGGMPSDYSRLAMCGLAGIAGGFVAGGVQRALGPIGLPVISGPPLGEVML